MNLPWKHHPLQTQPFGVISSGFWGTVQDFQHSVCTAIIAFSISPSGAAKLEVPGIWDIFPPICGLKLKIKKKKKQFAHFLQNSTQNPTESELCTHSHVYTHRDGKGVPGRCRRRPAFLGNTQHLLGGSKRKNPKTAPQDPLSHGRSPHSSWHLKSPFFPILSHFGCFFCCHPPTCFALPTQMELWEVVYMDPALLWPGKAPWANAGSCFFGFITGFWWFCLFFLSSSMYF